MAGEMFSSRANHVSAYNDHQPTKIEADFSKEEKMDTVDEGNTINDTGGILAEHEIDVTTNYEEQNATDARDGVVQSDQVCVCASSVCVQHAVDRSGKSYGRDRVLTGHNRRRHVDAAL